MVEVHFLLKAIPFLVMVPKSLPKNPPDCPISCNWVFENFILAETCVLVNNYSCGKLISSLESTTFD